jgi:anti-sigma regulatory factor (Ser/Thr protein kinase)
MKQQFARSIKSLEKVFSFTASFKAAHHLDNSTAYIMDLAIEEIFTNMIKYDRTKNDKVEISLDMQNNDLIISLTNFNVPEFDIMQTTVHDLSQDLKSRPVGKLGLHLIKSMMDDVEYIYKDKNSTVILKKHMGTQHV